MTGERLRDIDRLVESNRWQRRKRLEREEREDKLLIMRNLGTFRAEYNEYVKKTPITYEDYVRVKNHKITFVPKKKTKSTMERRDFPEKRRRGLPGEETNDFMTRIVMFVTPHKVPSNSKYEDYTYGKIQFDVDTELIGKIALVQVWIPKEPLDPHPDVPNSITSNFLNQNENEWAKMFENEEDRNARIKKEVESKIKEDKKGKRLGGWGSSVSHHSV